MRLSKHCTVLAVGDQTLPFRGPIANGSLSVTSFYIGGFGSPHSSDEEQGKRTERREERRLGSQQRQTESRCQSRVLTIEHSPACFRITPHLRMGEGGQWPVAIDFTHLQTTKTQSKHIRYLRGKADDARRNCYAVCDAGRRVSLYR